MGHSLGSFMTQYFISEHGEALAGAVLSGSNGKPPPIAPIGLLLAHLERLRLGQRRPQPVDARAILRRVQQAICAGSHLV